MLRLGFLLLALAAFTVYGAAGMPTPASAEESVDDIAGQLMCQCGCGLVVQACGGAMDCSIGDQMKAAIGDQLAQGKTRQQILSYFASVYGDVVLAAPSKSGFNLSAWLMPFAVVAAGAVILAWVLRLWLGRGQRETPEEEPIEDGDLLAYRERVEQELREQLR